MEIDDDLNDDQKKALYKNDCFLFAANSIICMYYYTLDMVL